MSWVHDQWLVVYVFTFTKRRIALHTCATGWKDVELGKSIGKFGKLNICQLNIVK